ncbi:hypothetical protein M0804_004731 [Polistes exclamans]|nr:hypothetical protein M0804_004731 [Polistes exclamans]
MWEGVEEVERSVLSGGAPGSSGGTAVGGPQGLAGSPAPSPAPSTPTTPAATSPSASTSPASSVSSSPSPSSSPTSALIAGFDKSVLQIRDWLIVEEEMLRQQAVVVGDVDEIMQLIDKQKISTLPILHVVLQERNNCTPAFTVYVTRVNRW